MTLQKYSQVIQYLRPEYGVAANFFDSPEAGDRSCIFLISCLSDETILYLEDSFEELTGYPPQLLADKGLKVWFSLIHPDDAPLLSSSIIKSHKNLTTPGFPRPLPPLVLEYRLRLENGEWQKIRETKYLLLLPGETAIDKVLCKLEFAGHSDKDESCSKLLDFALTHDKQSTRDGHVTSPAPSLTKREIEILQLIGKGLSTKMIANKCCISINTVESHRRRLLEKLNVRNSMQLIKEASKFYSLD
jgi:two-component system response regulator NreC